MSGILSFQPKSGWSGPTSGLIHRFPLDAAHISGSTAIDVVGGVNGTVSGTTSLAKGPKNIANTGLHFGGDAKISGFASHIFNDINAKTISTWFNFDDTTTVGGLFSDRLSLDGFGVRTNYSGASLYPYIVYGSNGAFYGISANAWYHFAMTFDGAGHNNFYIDGVQSGGTLTLGTEVAPLTTGILGAETSHNLLGSMAAVCVYNRVLPADEVALVKGAF